MPLEYFFTIKGVNNIVLWKANYFDKFVLQIFDGYKKMQDTTKSLIFR